jgi:hypothetical protein
MQQDMQTDNRRRRDGQALFSHWQLPVVCLHAAAGKKGCLLLVVININNAILPSFRPSMHNTVMQ